MRSIRVREVMLLAIVAALGLGWPLSVARLAKRAEVAELELGGALDRAEAAEAHVVELSTGLAEAEDTAEAEIERREPAEAALAECESRSPGP